MTETERRCIVKQKYKSYLLSIGGVRGIGLGKEGGIRVYIEHKGIEKYIPDTLDGFTVYPIVTEEIEAL